MPWRAASLTPWCESLERSVTRSRCCFLHSCWCAVCTADSHGTGRIAHAAADLTLVPATVPPDHGLASFLLLTSSHPQASDGFLREICSGGPCLQVIWMKTAIEIISHYHVLFVWKQYHFYFTAVVLVVSIVIVVVIIIITTITNISMLIKCRVFITNVLV